MTVSSCARRQFYDVDYFARGGVERRRGSWDRRLARDRRSGKNRRQFYDADYFARGGVERRRGSWDRRSGRDRRFISGRRPKFDPKYVFVPERRSEQDKKSRVERKICERWSGMDRRKMQIERRLLADLSRLKHTLERRKT